MLSLLFDSATRPCVSTVRDLAARDRAFSMSHEPDEMVSGRSIDPGWLEISANGLTFDLSGLKPGRACPTAEFRHRFGFDDSFDPAGYEALILMPGPHLAGGEAMFPVVRSQVWLAMRLCKLPGVAAVGWSPARSLCSVESFTDCAERWLEGDAFPASYLTSLAQMPDGGLQSEGLAFFTGQEIRIEPELVTDTAATARLGARLIHHLVARGRVGEAELMARPMGAPLRLVPSENGRFVRVWAGA